MGYQTLGYTTYNSHEPYKLNPAMVIKYNDNIGIGTTHPKGQVSIRGNNTGDKARITFQGDGNGVIGSVRGVTSRYLIETSDGSTHGYNTKGSLAFYVNNKSHDDINQEDRNTWTDNEIEAMRITSEGNVGIGGDPSIARLKVMKGGGGNNNRSLVYVQTFDANSVNTWQSLLNVSAYENSIGEVSLNQRGVSIGTHANSNGRCGTIHMSTTNGANNYYMWVDNNEQYRNI